MTVYSYYSYNDSCCPVNVEEAGSSTDTVLLHYLLSCALCCWWGPSTLHTYTHKSEQRTHAHKRTNLHLSKADSKLCLVIVYLDDAIDLTELEESLQSLGLLGS